MLGLGQTLPLAAELGARNVPLGDHPLGPVQVVAHSLQIRPRQGDLPFKLLGLLPDKPVAILEEGNLGGLEPQLSLEPGGACLTHNDLLLSGKLLQFRGIEPAEFIALLDRRAIVDHADDHRPISIGDILDLAGHRGFLGRLEITAGDDHCVQVGPTNLDPFDLGLRRPLTRLLPVRRQQPRSANDGWDGKNTKPDLPHEPTWSSLCHPALQKIMELMVCARSRSCDVPEFGRGSP